VCGIAGIVRATGLENRDHLHGSRLESLLAHRGPDGAGLYRDRSCALAQTRLALIGPRSLTLPVSSPDGRYTIVYNGEVYNFEELRRELQAGALVTDTEVVLASYLRWGRAAITRFNGMFAFFIWDAVEKRGFAACDPLGIKPFFYHASPGFFAFASEAGALVECGAIRFAPHDEAIAEALIAPYFSSVTALPFDGITRLAPGHWLELSDGRSHVHRYFDFEHARTAIDDPEEFARTTGDHVESAVVAALRADAPIGVFLSGGVDSSLLAAIARRPAWTISYQGEEDVDYGRSLIVKSQDRPFAERVAARHGFDHTIVRVNDADYETALLETLRQNDLISAWEQEVSQHLLARAAAHHVKAVLVGDAADETHFGYSFLLNPHRIESPQRVIEFFGTVPLAKTFLINPTGHFTCKYRKFAQDRGYLWDTADEQRLAISCLIYHLWLTRLLHNGDIHLMAHSLEGRVPFGDRGLLDLARQLPQGLGYRNGVEKWHLRRAAERFLEPGIAWRPKSALTKNMRAHRTIHRCFARAWRQRGDSIASYVDCDRVERLASNAVPETEVESGICFRLLALMTWFGRFQGART